jgi:hypothetical protein
MRLLRLILIGWLAIAVPTAAVASIVNAGHCQQMQEKPMAAGMDHSQHSMHAQDSSGSMAMAQMDHKPKPADNGCTCGCTCIGQHCATSFSSLMGALYIPSGLFDGTAQQIARMQPGHLTSAHHLDLLRPPTLS